MIPYKKKKRFQKLYFLVFLRLKIKCNEWSQHRARQKKVNRIQLRRLTSDAGREGASATARSVNMETTSNTTTQQSRTHAHTQPTWLLRFDLYNTMSCGPLHTVTLSLVWHVFVMITDYEIMLKITRLALPLEHSRLAPTYGPSFLLCFSFSNPNHSSLITSIPFQSFLIFFFFLIFTQSIFCFIYDQFFFFTNY